MATFRGPAWVQQEDKPEIQVEADLRSHTDHRGLIGWGGTLAGPVDWFETMGVELRLRTIDATGVFFVTSQSLGSDLVAITGSGPPPFAH